MPDANPSRAVELTLETFQALGVTSEDNHLFLPTTLRVRNATGGCDETKALLRLPDHGQRRRARLESRKECQSLGYDLDLDKDRFQEAENMWLLWFALREPETRGQLEVSVEEMLKRFPEQTLAEVWTRLQVWADMLDPRYGKLSGSELWGVIAEVALRGNMLPLAGMPGSEQATCIIVMAREALLSPNAPSQESSPSTSAPDA